MAEGYDEEELIKKITRILEGFMKVTEGATEGSKKNYAQMIKATISLQRHTIVETEATKRQTDGIKQRHVANMDFERYHNEQMRRNKEFANNLETVNQKFNYIKQSLTKGKGFGEILNKFSDGVLNATKKALSMQAALEDWKVAVMSGEPDKIVAEKLGVYEEKRAEFEKQDAGSKVLGKGFSKAGSFFKKHATGMVLGASVAGMLIHVITKALSVAPMFQAMMKLMKFAVTMVLMPIGTFFGAVLRPILVGLIKGMAPKFKEYMAMAMQFGNTLGTLFTANTDGLGGFIGSKVLNALTLGMFPVTKTGIEDIPTTEIGVDAEGNPTSSESTDYAKTGMQLKEDLDNFILAIITPFEEFAKNWDKMFQVTIPDIFVSFGTVLSTSFTNWVDGIVEDFETFKSNLAIDLDTIITEVTAPFLTFIGTINTFFLDTIPEALLDFADSFSEFWTGLFDEIVLLFAKIPIIGGWIKENFIDTKKELEPAINEAEKTTDIFEQTTNIFGGALDWIRNALRSISKQTETTSDGRRRPTRAAKSAIYTMGRMSGGNIDTSASMNVKKMANGGIIDEPILGFGASGQQYLMGESGREYVTPANNINNKSINVNIHIGKIEKNADFNQLKPLIQKWILDANSRRGMI